MSRTKTITNCEKNFLLKSLGDHNRLDGRAFDEFRELQIEFGKDLGCCYVSLGKTRVLAQVSCEIQQPKSSRPSEGVLNVNVELNPLASPDFEPGRQTDLSVQLNRLLEKCLKDSKAVDLESLCIKMNEKVWALRVDVNVLNHEGNILDCASVAALAALAHFKRPDVTCDGEEFIIHSYKERDPIPTVIHHYPVCISYGIFNRGSGQLNSCTEENPTVSMDSEVEASDRVSADILVNKIQAIGTNRYQSEYILADPSLLEEGVAEAQLTINLNSYKELCGLHLGGQAELTPDVILRTTMRAASRAGKIVEQIKEAIEVDSKMREKRQPIGFHHTISASEEMTNMKDLNTCINEQFFEAKTKKKKNKKSKPDTDNEEPDQIELLGDHSAALIPNDGDDTNPWMATDENE